MHPLCCALPVLYVPTKVTRGALVAHGNTILLLAAEPHGIIPLLISLRNDLADPVFDGVGFLLWGDIVGLGSSD